MTGEVKSFSRGKNILLVEDEALIALQESAVLKKHGYGVRVAGNASEAFAEVEKEPPDLILMDVNLGKGKMNGPDTAERILKDHDIPIVFLSSHTDQETVGRTEKITSFGYIVKNTGETVLIAGIRMAFRLHAAHQEIREREEWYESFFHRNSSVILILDPETSMIIDANQAAEDYYGWSAEELSRMPLRKILGDNSPGYLQHIEQIEKNGNSQFYQQHILANGENREVEIYSGTIKIQGKNLVYEIVHDIHDKIRAVHNSESRYRNLFELSPDGIITLNLRGRILSVNRAFENLSGYRAEDFVGKFFTRIPTLVPQDRETYKKIFRSILNRNFEDVEFSWRHRSGEIRSGQAKVKILYGKGEAPVVMGIIRDITRAKMEADRIRENEEFYSTILDHINESIWVSNENDEITFANIATSRISGLPNSEIIGKNVMKDFPRETLEEFEVFYYRAKETLEPMEYEAAVVTPTGTPTVHEGWLFPLVRDGVFNGMICTITVITERKKAEEELMKRIEMKDLLMRESNHRLKNNLAIISSLISLKNSSLPEPVDLSDLRSQIEAIRIVHERLTHSDDITQIDFKQYIDDLLKPLFFTFPAEIEIRNEIPELILPTNIAIPLGLIVNELATNAIKHGFSSPEKHLFTIQSRMDHHGPFIEFRIANSGNPLPEELNIEAPKTLGFQLINVLIRQLNGSLDVQRSPSPVFTIRIPADSAPGL